jgi:hypothetical protein
MDSKAIVNTMEVLEVKPISELLSEVTIKVCYVSNEPNRNLTVISKDVGREIAATLPGAPVAGFFNKETNDFEEHSHRITLVDGNFNIEDITKAYGFVDPHENPWYQDFEEEGKIRTYLMCKAYLWTRQYEEASLARDKGQSMELDEKHMSGYYSGDVFVFTSATLDKLCILGDSFEPCFEGAKIISTYAKQYESLAEKLENTLGRRYYVMDNKLIQKPEKITLEYAIQLGWNLSDAVYIQLANRGAEGKYSIEGIFAESGGQFVILQDRETLEYVRCELTITDADTVELGSEMLAVRQTWTVKSPSEPVAPDSLGGGTIPTPTDMGVGEYATDPKKVGETPAAATEYVVVTKYITVEKPATEPAATDPAATDPAPATEFTAQIAAKDAIIAERDATIETLNAEIVTYKAAEEAALKVKKDELIASYTTLLDKEEIAPIMEKVAEYSLEDLEAKLAVLFTRKNRDKLPNSQFQVNIEHLQDDDTSNLPEYMKQALEYDKANELKLI